MRRFACVALLALAGCYRWAPVTSLADINDDQVRVVWNSGDEVTLQHATAYGHMIRGDRMGQRVELDARDGVNIRRRALDGVGLGVLIGTAFIVTSVVLVTLTIVALNATRGVPEEGGN